MEITRQDMTKALTYLDNDNFKKVWDVMNIVVANDILEEIVFDLAIGAKIESQKDTQEYITQEELLADLGITMEDLRDDD